MYIWEYKQPDDAHGHYVGHNIIPTSIDQAFHLAIIDFPKGKRFEFWEDHHGSDIYYKKYIICLILKELFKEQNKNYNIQESSFTNYYKSLSANFLNSSIQRIDELSEIVSHIHKDQEFLSNLKFNISNLESIIVRLKKYFSELQALAEKQINKIEIKQKIDYEKVLEFKNNFSKRYSNTHKIINILDFYDLVKYEVKKKYKGKLGVVGIHNLEPKNIFFKEWHISSSDWGEEHATEMIQRKNDDILIKLLEHSKEIQIKELDEIINSCDQKENLFIITSTVSIYRTFEESNRYLHEWQIDSNKPEIPDFIGYIIFNDAKIPVFKVFSNIKNKFYLLNKNRFGKLIQYNPTLDEDGGSIKDIFYINVRSFNEDEKLLHGFLEKPPDWLLEKGNKDEQIEYLKKHVSVQIFERFELKIADNFWGYRVDLK